MHCLFFNRVTNKTSSTFHNTRPSGADKRCTGIGRSFSEASLTAEFAWEPGAVSSMIGGQTSLLQMNSTITHPTAGNGLANDVFGYAAPAADELAFVFVYPGGRWHTTFRYDADTDAWELGMDNEIDGEFSEFARVRLTRP